MTGINRTIDLMKLDTDQIILDLGCGDGKYSHLINQKHPRALVNLDISYSNLIGAKQESGMGISNTITHGDLYVCGDVLNLPFPEHSFDGIVCSLVLYLVPLQSSLDEIYRVLKPGGSIYLRVPMLAWSRVADAFRQTTDLHRALYCTNQFLSGLFFALTGKQILNPFLRNDHWACYIPLKRFKEAILDTGFEIDLLEIDKKPSIDAWLRKA